MEEILKEIFSNVNEWLKFAEAKNAALIALNLGSIFGAATIITQNDTTIPQWIVYYLYLFIIFNGLGFLVALCSFWPQTLWVFKDIGDINNVLYYGHIKEYNPDSYVNKIKKCYESREGKGCSSLEFDYVNQIIVNSRITFQKYKCFKLALLFTISALITPTILPFVFIYKMKDSMTMKSYKAFFKYFSMFVLTSLIAWKVDLILWKANI